MIQVLIAEVELDNADEFGVELGLQDSVLFDRSVLSDLLETITTTTIEQSVRRSARRRRKTRLSPPTTRRASISTASRWATRAGKASPAPSTVGTQGLSTFNLGRVNSELGYGGLVLSRHQRQRQRADPRLAAARRIEVLGRPADHDAGQPAGLHPGRRTRAADRRARRFDGFARQPDRTGKRRPDPGRHAADQPRGDGRHGNRRREIEV